MSGEQQKSDLNDLCALKSQAKRGWQKLSAGAGAKGHRFYDWAVIDLADPRPGTRQLLIRRNRSTGELAYYRCYSPAPVPLATLMRVGRCSVMDTSTEVVAGMSLGDDGV